MKFKKVEISAFRIFDDPKDATFELTNKSGNPADFVSLYAPNGFGKTSFYDAVEFGMTKSINRFYIRNKEFEKLANFQLVQNELPLIRNSKSVKSRKTFVRIYTDQAVEPQTTPFTKQGRQIHDLNFKKPVENDFQKVILSQEWISAFLTEQDGEFRYQKFMERPELSSINNYYKNLKIVYSDINKQIADFNNTIIEHEKQIQTFKDDNILQKVNEQIHLLSEHYNDEKIIPLSLSSTQEDIKRLKDQIGDIIITTNRAARLQELLNDISIIKSGNNSIIGVEAYFSLRGNNQKSHLNLSQIQDLLEKFKRYEKLNNESITYRSNQDRNLKDQNILNQAIAFFKDYERIFKENKSKQEKIVANEQSIISLNLESEELNRRQMSLQSQLKSILSQLSELESDILKLPEMTAQIDQLKISIEKLEKDIKALKILEEFGEKKQREVNSEIDNLNPVLQDISRNLYPEVSKDENEYLYNLINEIYSHQATLSKENEKLSKLSKTIEAQQSLNHSIADFIKLGLAIVNEQQTSSCPLCEQTYDSYNSLINKITSNKALNEVLQVLLQQKNEIEVGVFEINSNLKEKREQLISYYELRLEELLKSKQENQQNQNKLKIEIQTLIVELQVQKGKSDELNTKFGGLSLEGYLKQLEFKIKESNEFKTTKASEVDSTKESFAKTSEQLVTLRSKIELLKEEIQALQKDEKYIFINSYFDENFPGKERTIQLLQERETVVKESIERLETINRELEATISAIESELASYKEEDLVSQKSTIEYEIAQNIIKLDSFQIFLKDRLEVDLTEKKKEELIKDIEEKQDKYNDELQRVKKLYEEYERLKAYSDNIWPFLQSENAKKIVDEAKQEFKFLNEEVEPKIRRERDYTKEYLEKRIKDFFHEKLINSIYKKIDPHPDFKTVEFKANFDSDSPRLDVFVKNVKDESTLIPNLYFSTAQINILSLSIFLASALNVKEYQCIFIDDPIQSMDSINVLSTIDLLRSIVVNEGKQIILSTHDENFHNLLKKKMPPELFDSKFLELETFGKVKTDAFV